MLLQQLFYKRNVTIPLTLCL